MKSISQTPKPLALDGAKHARFASGSLTELFLGKCGRVNRGSRQFAIIGDATLALLATRLREVCDCGDNPSSRLDCIAEVTPRLFVRFTLGTERNGDAGQKAILTLRDGDKETAALASIYGKEEDDGR